MKKLFQPTTAYDWKPSRRPLTERQKYWIAAVVAPFAAALIACVVRGDIILLWRWISSKL